MIKRTKYKHLHTPQLSVWNYLKEFTELGETDIIQFTISINFDLNNSVGVVNNYWGGWVVAW